MDEWLSMVAYGMSRGATIKARTPASLGRLSALFFDILHPAEDRNARFTADPITNHGKHVTTPSLF